MLAPPLTNLGGWKKILVKKKKNQTQKLEGMWDFKYEFVMASIIPHNKFIFILTSDPPILSLNFFLSYFYSNMSIFS